MLKALLLRDLRIHRRVTLLSGTLPILVSVGPLLSARPERTSGTAILGLLFGMTLMCLLPLSLHLRETTLGTLGDLLSLPATRTQVVRLRFMEGVAAALLFQIVHLTFWMGVERASARDLLALFWSPFLPWLFLAALAYPMPFTLRWGGKGLAVAFALALAVLWLWMALQVFGPRYDWLRPLLTSQASLAKAFQQVGILGNRLFQYVLPLALISLFYAASIRAFEGKDV